MKEPKTLGKDILITTLVLVIIAVVAGAILGVVNHFAQIDEAEVLAKKLDKVCPNDGKFSDDLLETGIDKVDKRGQILGIYAATGTNKIIMKVQGNGAYKQRIEILILIEDYKIKNIEKFKSEETPGLGAEAFKEKHFKQYIDKDFKDLEFVLKKNGKGNIDAVSGATKTSTAMNNAISLAIEYYKAHYDTLVGGDK